MRIFICTSDVTSWMLRACLWLLDRHWPQHPPVVVGGYTRPSLPGQSPPGQAVEFFKIGNFADYPFERWSDGLIKFLASQPDDIFLWHMDDFWLVRDVDDQAVRLLEGHLRASPMLARIDLTTDRLFAGTMRAAGPLGHVHLVLTPPNTPYQLSFQSGLWRREALLQYLAPGEDPGQSEVRGAHRMTRAAANVLGTIEAPFRYLIAMQHGQLHIDDSGYQVPPVRLLSEDRAELNRLGLLSPSGSMAPEWVLA